MNLNNSVKSVLEFGKNFLKENKIETYSIDASVLLMYTINFTKTELYTKNNYEIDNKKVEEYKKLLYRRSKKEPVQYIVGKCEFMSLEFNVNKYTLIPRADTEILVENAINIIKDNNYKNILDIGTGSGAISVSIAYYCKNCIIDAVDISKKALETAKLNSLKNKVSEKINFIESNLFANIENKKYDCIISNPPYIKKDDINTLDDQVKLFEPITALDGGISGLDFYSKIAEQSLKHLNFTGSILFEIGFDQGNDVMKILNKNGFSEIKIIKDLAGFDRVVLGVYKKA